MPVPEVPKLVKPKVYQKTYQSGFLFHNYDYTIRYLQDTYGGWTVRDQNRRYIK